MEYQAGRWRQLGLAASSKTLPFRPFWVLRTFLPGNAEEPEVN
jgi:hypothetical protein